MIGGCFSAKRTVGRGDGESDETELGGVGRESSLDSGEGEEDVDELLGVLQEESAEELEAWDEVRLRGWVSSRDTVGVKPYSKSDGSSSSSLQSSTVG